MPPTVTHTTKENEELRKRYAELARLHEPAILRHALRLCGGNLDWASDLAQDALITGFKQSLENKLDYDGNARAWFLRVVTTRFINEFRRKKKWTSETPIDKIDEVAALSERVSKSSSVDSPFDEVLDGPLELALAQIPDDYRICVLLIDVEEMSYAEAAELLQVPVGTIRSRLARARLKLYTLLLPYAKSRRIV
jgi:RNA polymerase sigma-70 factor (ECF subfamily)